MIWGGMALGFLLVAAMTGSVAALIIAGILMILCVLP